MNTGLERFIDAQHNSYAYALAEIKSGKKKSHWMWFIFPQITGLGESETSKYYAIKDIEEAANFLHHEILGNRLIEISKELLMLENNNARAIFGFPDYLKLQSSMTLFSQVENTHEVFLQVLDKFFDGQSDNNTIQILNGNTNVKKKPNKSCFKNLLDFL